MLKAAIIGCGNIAGGYDEDPSSPDVLTHAKAYQHNDSVELVAACDIDRSIVDRFCHRWTIPHGFTNITEMMGVAQPDMVSICSPSEFHFDHFNLVMDFPLKAIICEKPMALSVREAEAMVTRTDEKGTILAVNFSRRWMRHFDAVTHDIDNNELGDIQAARFLYTKGLFHNGSHFINLAERWFGPLQSVTVFHKSPWQGNDVQASFYAGFERCSNVVFQNCYSRWYEVAEIDILGRFARLEILRGGQAIRKTEITAHPVLPDANCLSPDTVQTEFGDNHAMPRLVQNVVDAVTHGKPLAMRAGEALSAIRACERVRENPVI